MTPAARVPRFHGFERDDLLPVDSGAARAVVRGLEALDVLLGLLHLLLDLAAARLHLAALLEHLRAEYQEEGGGARLGPLAGDEGGEDVTELGGQYRHDDEGGKRAREDNGARMAHGKDGGNEERLVSDLRDDNHGKRPPEGVEGALVGHGCDILRHATRPVSKRVREKAAVEDQRKSREGAPHLAVRRTVKGRERKREAAGGGRAQVQANGKKRPCAGTAVTCCNPSGPSHALL